MAHTALSLRIFQRLLLNLQGVVQFSCLRLVALAHNRTSLYPGQGQEQNFGNKHWPGKVRGKATPQLGKGSSRSLSQRHTKVRATIDAGKFWYLEQGRALRWHQQSSDVQTGGVWLLVEKKPPTSRGYLLRSKSIPVPSSTGL